MADISTIKPAAPGDEDFTTLQAWEDWADDDPEGLGHAGYHAECYGGGDLGTLILADWSDAPDATNYPRIYAAAGEKHEGSYDADKARIVLDAGYTILFQANMNYVRIESIQIQGATDANGFTGISVVDSINVIIDSVLFDIDFTAWVGPGHADDGAIGVTLFYNPGDFFVRNCIFFMRAGSTSIGLHCMLRINALDIGGVSRVYLYNNSFYCKSPQASSTGIVFASPWGNITIKNTITSNFSFNYLTLGSWSKTTSNNISSDGTLGGHTVEAASTTFTDPSNFDLTLKAGSAAINGGADLSGEGFAVDILGEARPVGPSWDIGAFESILGLVSAATRKASRLLALLGI